LVQFPALGQCAPGTRYVYANAANVLFTDNPLFVASALPLVTSKNPVAPSPAARLDLGALLLRAPNSATLEKVRTFLTVYDSSLATAAGVGLTGWQMGDVEPETFGEVAQIRNDDDDNIESVVLAIVGLTLLVAACSLAVTVGGGIVERKRPFTLLRVSGTPRLTLYKVVLTESMLPLVGAAVVAAGVAVAITAPLVRAIPKIQKDAYLAVPGVSYYVAMGAGLLIALMVVAVTLPVLDRVTSPDKVRFE
jgi:ABC-type antimicrobial peptide transport system permease subunit